MKVKKATILFLIKDGQILLALKKRGFGKDYWNGAGGKVEEKETPKAAAIRETQEEINVIPKNLKKVAMLDFFIPEIDKQRAWIQRAFVYISQSWDGKPKETEEMKPKWFKFSEIPYTNMWSDDSYWLPKILEGKKIKAKFWFNKDLQVIKHQIWDIDLRD
jgi:8-oxo-dGTP diphosphatase